MRASTSSRSLIATVQPAQASLAAARNLALDTLAALRTQLRSNEASARENVAATEAELTRMAARLGEAQAQATSENKRREEEAVVWRTAVENLGQSCEALKASIAVLQRERQAEASRREDAQARLEEATAAHAHAHERANGLSKQLIDVAAINTGLSASLAQRELELAAAQAAAIQQATAVAEITAACSTLQMRSEAAEARLATLTAQVAALPALFEQTQAHTRALAESRAREDELATQLAEKTASLHVLHGESEIAADARAELALQLANTRAAALSTEESLRSEMASLAIRLKQTQMVAAETENELTCAVRQVQTDAEARLRELRETAADLELRLSAAENNSLQATGRAESYEKKLSETQKVVDKLKVRAEKMQQQQAEFQKKIKEEVTAGKKLRAEKMVFLIV